MVCRFPGCVASAPCPVHDAAPQGKRCLRCAGTGRVSYLNEQAAKREWAACDRCGGTGLLDQSRSMRIPASARMPVDQRGLLRLLDPDE